MRPTGEYTLSPADQAREHIARVSETGTTDGIDVLGSPIVLLTTRGVRSGEPRTVPLMRIEHDGDYAVVASRGGAPRNPGWYLNVTAEPHVHLQDGAVTKDYTAREVTGEEKASWWARAIAVFPLYDRIRSGIEREIPVFVLEETTVSSHVRTAADRLLEAARTATPCAPVRDLLPDGELATGYAVQSLVTRANLEQGRRPVGRKIGLTAPTVQAQLGVDRPDIGVLFEDMACPQHEQVDIGRLLQPRIEAEIAFVLAADLDHDDLTDADARAAVEYAVAAFEIVDSRIAGWDITLVDTVADNASSGLYVLGDDRVELAGKDLRTVEMTMTDRSGETVSSGSGSDCLGDPIAALLWLARAALEVGSPLRAGEVVLSGALGPMVPVTAGGTYRASLSGLGTVEATFSSTPTDSRTRR